MQAFGFLKRFREALMRGVGVIYKYNICIYIYIYIYYIFNLTKGILLYIVMHLD